MRHDNQSTSPYLPKIAVKSKDFLCKDSFECITIIGRGGFGKVWKVMHKKTRKFYAMKQMSKARILDTHCSSTILFERNLLSKINHPFIVNLHYAFQDNDFLYLILDLLTGGDLRYHQCSMKTFAESQVKFLVASILLGLEYCHVNGIIHRDIKPENIILDSRGYVKITDFGIAQIQQQGNRKESSGTLGYMAPEIICSQDHTIAADYFSLGVIAYELVTGTRPYSGKNRKEIKEKMMSKQIHLSKGKLPKTWSLEGGDLINKLIERKQSCRLGKRGPQEIKDHVWFKNYPWKELYLGQITAPFIPSKSKDNVDRKYCNAIEKIDDDTKKRYEAIMVSGKYKHYFDDFALFNRYDDDNSSKSNNNQGIGDKEIVYNNPHIVFELARNESNSISILGKVTISDQPINSYMMKHLSLPLSPQKSHQHYDSKSMLGYRPPSHISNSNSNSNSNNPTTKQDFNSNFDINNYINTRKSSSQKSVLVDGLKRNQSVLSYHTRPLNKNMSCININNNNN